MKDLVLPDKMNSLPVSKLFPVIADHWKNGVRRYVIQADPGAGKSTAVPLFLLNSHFMNGKIVMLEPRRMAARSLAGYMASRMGEKTGQTIGYRVRGEGAVSVNTRVEIVTEGVFIRMIQEDPELKGIGAVILDEFHERNILSDLSYALLMDVMENLRPELACFIMSATPEKRLLEEKFTRSVYLESEGRMFPVQVEYRKDSERQRIDYQELGQAVSESLHRIPGDILVFLPGEGEIRKSADFLDTILKGLNHQVLPLYGRLSFAEQERVFKPSGKRKVILATSIAETSLTIPGVRVVIDTGWERHSEFNRHSGLTKLATRRISRASADQRAGRAGRVSDGLCIRLWSEQEHRSLVPFREPEILTADLSSLVLEILSWGCRDYSDLQWLEPPPKAHYHQALGLLTMLEAVDHQGRILPAGRSMAFLGLHPRLSHLILEGERRNAHHTACMLAALLSERDWMNHSSSSDILARIDRIKTGRDHQNPLVKRIIAFWQKLLKEKPDPEEIQPESVGPLLLKAFPDRVGMLRNPLEYHLSGGGNAFLKDSDPLQSQEYLIILDTGGTGQVPTIFLSCPVQKEDILRECREILEEKLSIHWNEKQNRLESRMNIQLGDLLLQEKRCSDPPVEMVSEELKRVFQKRTLKVLPWTRDDQEFLNRCRFMKEEEWPDFSETGLIESLSLWFIPLLRKGRLERSLKAGLRSLLSWEQQQTLEKSVPERVIVPSGSRLRLDYSDPEKPALDVKIQEMFGMNETPLIGKSTPLLIRLLNPAGRPIQVTEDLKSFWENTYPQVRKELRGRYVKHYWPENPYEAEPTRRVKPGKK